MTQRTPRRRLVLTVYAFTAALSVAIMAALLVLPRYTRSAKYLEPQAALLQFLVDRWSTKNPAEFDQALARITPRLRGGLTLFDANGTMMRTNEQPPLDPPDSSERSALNDEKWALAWNRIVVRSDDGSMIGVYTPNRPGFPWSWVLPIGAIILVAVGAASMWFTRRLAQPLDKLANAARKFGAGDFAARAALRRDDELGDVSRAFDDMADRTSAVMQAQRQLMGDVSHELRTPLARIRVALELVVEDPIAAKDVLTDVSGDLDEIDQLIEDILTTARLDGDHAKINRTPTSIGELADRATKRFRKLHPKRELERTFDGEDAAIDCDPLLLRRAIDNLLDNAVKYSEIGTGVKLAIQPSGQRIAFEIVDCGIGMSVDDLERAFTPFWRADSSRTRKTGGVGLGLALARRIARAHGGDVTLSSVPGKGTTARLELPLSST